MFGILGDIVEGAVDTVVDTVDVVVDTVVDSVETVAYSVADLSEGNLPDAATVIGLVAAGVTLIEISSITGFAVSTLENVIDD